MAAAHVLHYGVGVPVRKVPAVLRALPGVELSQGAISQDALRRARGAVGDAYHKLRGSVRAIPLVHTDDTGWRVDGGPAFLMAFETDEAMVYRLRARQSLAGQRALRCVQQCSGPHPFLLNPSSHSAPLINYDISLPSGRAIVVVRIPEGAFTPYILRSPLVPLSGQISSCTWCLAPICRDLSCGRPSGSHNRRRTQNYPYQAAWTQVTHHPRREPS